jgi:hypothetical protein
MVRLAFPSPFPLSLFPMHIINEFLYATILDHHSSGAVAHTCWGRFSVAAFSQYPVHRDSPLYLENARSDDGTDLAPAVAILTTELPSASEEEIRFTFTILQEQGVFSPVVYEAARRGAVQIDF